MMKIFVYIIFLMFLTTVYATISLSKENNTVEKIDDSFASNYIKCYIEASGKISQRDWFAIIRMTNMWKTFWFRPPLNELKAFVSFWRIVYQADSQLTIYSEENGDIIWDHNGEQEIHLIILGFNGIYIPQSGDPNGPLHVEISGNVWFVKPKLI